VKQRRGARRFFHLPFFSRWQVERDVDDELSFHLEMKAQEMMRSGVPADEARREARRRFGDIEYTRRYCRAQSLGRERAFWRRELLFDLGRDLRYGLRQLRRGYGVVAVAVLALGMGASITAFSVVNGVLLEPLPYADSQRLVRIWDTGPRFDGRTVNVNPLNFLDWEAEASDLESLGEARLLPAAFTTHGLIPTLRLTPIMGRAFTAEEDREDGRPVVLLSHSFWSTEMGGDPLVLGESLTIDGQPHEIIGVLGPNARLPGGSRVERPALWLPSGIGAHNGRGGHWLYAVGRLAPGVEIERAQEELSAVARALAAEYPSSNKGVDVLLEPLRDSIVSGAREAMTLLVGAVGLLLLLACGNVANMLLARSVARRSEIGVRAALGASRGRLVRQFLAESLCMAAAGGLIGLVLAAAAVHTLSALGAPGIPRLDEIGLDLRVVGATGSLIAVSALAVGLVPGLFGVGRSPLPALSHSGARGGRDRTSVHLEGGLAVFQIALATVLVTAAGLLFHSLLRLRAVDPGFETRNVVAIRIILPQPAYDDGHERIALLRDLLRRARALPGVSFAGASDSPPLQREQRSRSSFQPEDRPEPPPDQRHSAWEQYVTPGYLRAVGIPVLAGRAFDDRDDAEGQGVILVNEVLARSIWPGEEAVGKRIRYNGSREVVGVVGSARRTGLDTEPSPEMFLPYAQWAYNESMFVTLRTIVPAERTVAEFRSMLRELDPGIPIGTVATMEQLVSSSLAGRRFRFAVLGTFGAVALLLAVVGVYAVLGYVVSRRRREFGLRLAVGANPTDILRLVMRRGLGLALIGIALGLVGSVIAARALESFLYGVRPIDPGTYAAVVALFLLVTALACWVPARRATRTDPTLSLRLE
jgi:predicted permease